MPGGRIPPDNRGPAAKGVGKNSKRHDMERQATPGLHGSDLQQGDIKKLERGQRIAPIRTQPSAGPKRQPQPSTPPQGGSAGMQVPDAIEFLGGRQGSEFDPTPPVRDLATSRAVTWLPVLRELAVGPGSSGLLASTLITQARRLGVAKPRPATVVDLRATDDAIEALVNEEQ